MSRTSTWSSWRRPRSPRRRIQGMTPSERALRADAERNRRRVLDAAQALFRERGLDVGVAEIAQRAGVGRGTLFRNFPTKQDLVAAIVIDRMHEATEYGRTLLGDPDAGEAFFGFLEEIVGRQLDLVRAAITPSGADRPLRGRPPTLADVERAHPAPPVPAPAVESVP